MTTTILATKTGTMNMGGYFKEKTIQVYTHTFNINGVIKQDKYFRFKYTSDACEECFDTFEEAMIRFNKACKWITNKGV